jgi:hypothetical protein
VSYDVSVFFRESRNDVDERSVLDVTERLAGIRLEGFGLTARVLGVRVELWRRGPSLRDEPEKPYSAFSCQMDLGCSAGSIRLIHPIALFLAEAYSGEYRDRAMVCLNGVEFLGAIFERGRLVVDNMAKHQDLYIGSRWRYQPE